MVKMFNRNLKLEMRGVKHGMKKIEDEANSAKQVAVAAMSAVGKLEGEVEGI